LFYDAVSSNDLTLSIIRAAYGANINWANAADGNQTPLHKVGKHYSVLIVQAASQGNMTLLTWLLHTNPIDLSVQDSAQRTALDLANVCNKKNAAQWLQKKGVPSNASVVSVSQPEHPETVVRSYSQAETQLENTKKVIEEKRLLLAERKKKLEEERARETGNSTQVGSSKNLLAESATAGPTWTITVISPSLTLKVFCSLQCQSDSRRQRSIPIGQSLRQCSDCKRNSLTTQPVLSLQ
jgi:hypothetical protein